MIQLILDIKRFLKFPDMVDNTISDVSSFLQQSPSHAFHIHACSLDITVQLCYLPGCWGSVHPAMTGSNTTHTRVT